MHEYTNVIVMQGTGVFRDSLVGELAEYAFAVRGCGGMLGFLRLYEVQPAPLIVLAGSPDDVAGDARQVREVAASAVVIVLSSDTSMAGRLRAMAAGADACYPAPIDIRELAAVLKAWSRHVAPTASTAPTMAPAPVRGAASSAKPGLAAHERWRLADNGRVLACPRGRKLPLTASESLFLGRLMISSGQLLHRRDAVTEASAARGARPPQTPRNVDVLVSRLRRKAREGGMDLPLRAVRGCGYLFLDGLDAAA